MDKLALLRKKFGHGAFRPGQEELIDALLSGRDVLGVMPTGAGKSVCYQLPALLLPGVTLVVSPLISLMKDQVAALAQAGVPAAYINSSLSYAQCREALRRAAAGAYRLIYVAPERLSTEDFLNFADQAPISMVAVDEAHCVSQWGQDFRPSYLKIAEFVESLPRRPVVGAFTATATDQVKEDISRLLRLRDPLCVTTGFDRPNLFFQVARPKNKLAYLEDYVENRPDESGIVYCATRKNVESVCQALRERGVAATRYHAGLADDERRQNQDDFVYDRARVMVATNAFGMGIDKSNVSFVLHYNMPKNLESYYQEAGRAGRDGERADCTLLYSAGDVQTAKFLINNSEDNEALTPEEQEVVLRRDLERLNKMVGYCKTDGCLRGYILGYFGQAHPKKCGSCGGCLGERRQRDITVEAQKILSAVARVELRHPSGLGASLIVLLLAGSREQRVLQLGLDTLPTYGALREMDRDEIRTDVELLLREGLLIQEGEDYPVLRLTEEAKEVLFKGRRVVVSERVPHPAEGRDRRREPSSGEADEGLFRALKELRRTLAQRESVPAYIVFTNAALADMAARKPENMAEFLQVSGVGEAKASRYGTQFISAIRDYLENGAAS